MDLKKFIDETFEQEVKTLFEKKPSVIPMLMNNPRLAQFKELHVRREIKIAEMKYGVRMNRLRLEQLVRAHVSLFCNLALEEAIWDRLSPAEKERRKRAANAEQTAAEVFNELLKDGVVQQDMTHKSLDEREDTGAGIITASI